MSRLLFPAKAVFFVISAFTLWQGWVFLRPEPREYSPAEKRAIEKSCTEAATQLKTMVEGPQIFGVAHFVNDPSDTFTEAMRDRLSQNPEWQVKRESIIQQFLGDVSAAVKNATSLDEIVHAGRRVDLDLVVAGKVGEVADVDDGGARAEAFIRVYDVKRGNMVFSKTIAATWRPSLLYKTKHFITNAHPIIRFIVWTAFVLLLPLVTTFATHWAVDKDSNVASVILLSLYTTIDFLAAMVLTGFEIGATWKGWVLSAALLLCALYNFWVCERIAERA